MVQGCRPPERSHFYTPTRVQGQQLAQTTHVQAPFSVDMAQGVTVPQTRYSKPQPQGLQWWTPEVQAFSIEMVIGSHPDQARFFSGPRTVGWQTSQTTPVANFSPEMAQGWHSDINRAFIPPKLGWSFSQTTHTAASFSIEMVSGSAPVQSRAVTPSHVGLLVVPINLVSLVTSAVWAAAGLAPVSFVAASTAASVWAATGVGAASWVGRSTAAAIWAAAGIGQATWTGASRIASVFVSAGVSSVNWVNGTIGQNLSRRGMRLRGRARKRG